MKRWSETKAAARIDKHLKEDVTQVQTGRFAPRMFRFIPSLVALIAVAVVGGWLVFVGLARLSGHEVLPWWPRFGSVASTDEYDLIRSSVAVAALFGGLFAVVYSYRKQRVEEAAGHRADAEGLSRRYQDAAEQLGHEKAAVRLAGVYALARLADDWPDQRQTCVDVLCAYIRMPWDLLDEDFVPGEPEPPEAHVRRVIMDVITNHLKQGALVTWRNLAFDFRGAKLLGVSMHDVRLETPLLFEGAEFLDHAGFKDSTFSAGIDFTEVLFHDGVAIMHCDVGNLLNLSETIFPAGTVSALALPVLAAEDTVVFRGGAMHGAVTVVVRPSHEPQGRIFLDYVKPGGGDEPMRIMRHTLNAGSDVGAQHYPVIHRRDLGGGHAKEIELDDSLTVEKIDPYAR